MILPIYTYGQPVLRQQAQDITPDYPELPTLIANMFETLTASDGVGLAAPQVGLAIRLAVIDLDVISDDEPQYKDFRRAYINPEIVEVDDSETEVMEEGCLSLPGIHEPVRRPKRIHVTYLDEQFQPHDEWVASCSMSSTTSTDTCSSTAFPPCAARWCKASSKPWSRGMCVAAIRSK